MRDGALQWIRWFKKHAFLPLLAISVALLVATFSHVSGARNNGTAQLIDLEGDRSALEDVTIGGYIRDGYHEMNFAWKNGEMSKETIVYDLPRKHPWKYVSGAPLPNGDHVYELHPAFFGGNDFEIRSWRSRDGLMSAEVEGIALVQTSLHYKGASDGRTFTNVQEKGLAFIGDRVFFVPPTTRDYTGTSGIYEVLQFGQRNTMQQPETAESRVLAELDMDGNRPGEWKGLEVLGLEAVGDKLALIALVDSEIVVRGYDSITGDTLGEVRLGEYVYTLPAESGPPADGGYYENYEAFVDEDIEMLNLKFYGTDSPVPQSRHFVASISFQDGIETVNRQVLHFEDKDRYSAVDSNYYSFRNGKLYAITISAVPPEMYTQFERLYDTKLLVEVYAAGERLYSGELRTDINEDLVEDRYLASAHDQQDRSQYREIDGLHIGSVK